ncbi:hypothetical protein QJ856_gp0886 [Tupanvirus deep ocean]|uniref:Uncharacterized protein n=2 Tax=Tupanvirus TaxID=2094720 RepID=A0AC62A874_9VIRU|nr:hypothetical protein QJ856_gp0886 [Tupanvirus deep ocean]QKU33870.1 hypothetical protein [Tupanvirus deep ocean]
MMSFSKPYFTFPYYDYPYTIKDKFSYYGGKMICTGMSIFGVSLYARFLWKQPYLSDKEIKIKKSSELTELVNISNKKRNWHLKGIFANIIITIPGLYYFQKYLSIPNSYLLYVAFGASAFLLNNIYGVLAHTYNSIRFKNQLNIINHGANIARAIKAVSNEFESMHIENTEFMDKMSIDDIIYNQLATKKVTWNMIDCIDEDTQQSIHVISNGYYENLIFVFNIELTAKDFIKELKNLSTSQIDYLHLNPSEAQRLQNEFIKNRLYSNLVYKYYLQK